MIHRCVDNIKCVVKCLALQIFRKGKAPKKNMSHLWFSSFWLSEIEDCQEATCCLIWLKHASSLKVWVFVCVCVCAHTPVEELSGSLKPVPFSVYLFTYSSSCYSAFFLSTPLLSSAAEREAFLFALLFVWKKGKTAAAGAVTDARSIEQHKTRTNWFVPSETNWTEERQIEKKNEGTSCPN